MSLAHLNVMNTSTKHEARSLGDWASLAVKKHFQKVLKHEADVLKDRDPEALHQMRVGMRRLRSAINGFAPALSLPKSAGDKKIGKISKRLGVLRDLDVLLDTLQKQHQPTLPPAEQESLEIVVLQLSKRRDRVFAQVKETLKDGRYQTLKQSLKVWLKQPSYREIAEMPIQEVLPDLLLPEVGRLLLHPGWLVGTEVRQGAVAVVKQMDLELVERQLADRGPLLHSLRKEIKRVRYQMELFADFYGESYGGFVSDVKVVQGILGEIQDSSVLAECLTDVLKSRVEDVFPTLSERLLHVSYEAWQKWQVWQQRYLEPGVRLGFHLAVLRPVVQGGDGGTERGEGEVWRTADER
jgi:CHAD domain-containing protein